MAKVKKIVFPEIEAQLARRGENYAILGNAIGMSRTSIHVRMRGAVEWSLPEIKAVCEYFGMSFDDLFVRASE